jgi:hypothetical protein
MSDKHHSTFDHRCWISVGRWPALVILLSAGSGILILNPPVTDQLWLPVTSLLLNLSK